MRLKQTPIFDEPEQGTLGVISQLYMMNMLDDVYKEIDFMNNLFNVIKNVKSS